MVVIGDEKGRVGVGTATAKEVVDAVQKGVSHTEPTWHRVKSMLSIQGIAASQTLQLTHYSPYAWSQTPGNSGCCETPAALGVLLCHNMDCALCLRCRRSGLSTRAMRSLGLLASREQVSEAPSCSASMCQLSGCS